MQRLRFVSVQFLRSPYSPFPKRDTTRSLLPRRGTGILRQPLAKPSLLCLIKASLLNSYIEFGQLFIEFGQSLIEFGQSFIEFGQSFIEFGQSLIEFGQSFIEFGQSLIEFGQTPRIYIKPFKIFVINKLI
ncbi:MAG: hypothetical protein V7K77_01515 [Nostoc sp.]|uniref:hypothetical protein n=1 Tax=Nostoc sp. TaxID=1180 RepID=UPI002FF4DAC8